MAIYRINLFGKGDELRFIEVGQIPSEGGCDE